MNPRRPVRPTFRGRGSPVLLAAAFFVLGAQPAHANDPNGLSSSMSAKCLGVDCSQVTFQLDITGAVFVDHVVLSSLSSMWTFGSLIQVVDGLGNDVTANYGGKFTDDEFELMAYTYPPFVYRADPLQLTLQMEGFGRQGQLENMVEYRAFGDTESGPRPHDAPFTTAGTATVAPEPETWLLMATGLAILGFFAWRRREQEAVAGSVSDAA